jgi:DNA-binding transcriptional LysR family regulator
MHFETLRTFCDLVETKSLSRAAKLNRVTQSAVSQQLRALEARYGRKLIDRAPRIGAEPTEAGTLLYTEVKPLLERFAAVEQRLREQPNRLSGTVRVASVYSVGLHTLPPALKKSLSVNPDVRVRLEYRRTDQVYDACASGEVDLGIVALPRHRAGLAVVPLGEEELCLVVSPDHSLSAKKAVALRELDGVPFVAFERDIPTRRFVDRALRGRARVSYVMELDNIETIKRCVEAGIGVSILPMPAVATEVRARTLVALRIQKKGALRRPIGAIYRRSRELSPAARTFLELLRAEL